MKPNILFILTDQQNWSMMGCAGNPFVRTPAMDRIAAGGVRFDRAYCTNPLCVPSRFSLMTGRMPGDAGILSNSVSHLDAMPEQFKGNGLGRVLRAAGYETAYGGKVHLPLMNAGDVGFDYFCRDERDGLALACAEFIGRKRDKPFFLAASFTNPHDICYMALRDFAATEAEQRLVANGIKECRTLDEALRRPAGMGDGDFFAKICPPLPPNFEISADEPEAIGLMLEQRPFRMKARKQWTPRRWQEHRWAYARLTEMVDAQIAVVLDALERSGKAGETLVVFTSDHGDMDSARRLEHKSMLYDEACRVPLVISPPGCSHPGRVDNTHPVSNGLDLFPTFCDWAGAPVPPGLAGRSLRALAENAEAGAWRESVPVECAIGRAVITGSFKYSVYDMGANREQLIDLANDPFEQRNALNDTGLRETADTLKRIWRATFGNGQRDPDVALRAATEA